MIAVSSTVPDDSVYWESVADQCEYRAVRVEKIAFLTIELGYTRHRSQRGWPVLAGGEIARRILKRLRDLS